MHRVARPEERSADHLVEACMSGLDVARPSSSRNVLCRFHIVNPLFSCKYCSQTVDAASSQPSLEIGIRIFPSTKHPSCRGNTLTRVMSTGLLFAYGKSTLSFTNTPSLALELLVDPLSLV